MAIAVDKPSLVFVAVLAHSLAKYFSGEAIAAEKEEIVASRVRDELARLRTNAERSAIAQTLARNAVSPDPALFTIFTLLDWISKWGRSERLRTLCGQVFSAYGQRPFEDQARNYQERRKEVHSVAAARMERYLVNYSVNLWNWEWNLHQPPLEGYILRWLTRVGLLHVLLVGHPKVTAILREEPRGSDPLTALDRLAAEVVQVFTKEVEHPQSLRNAIAETVLPKDADPFPRALSFAMV